MDDGSVELDRSTGSNRGAGHLIAGRGLAHQPGGGPALRAEWREPHRAYGSSSNTPVPRGATQGPAGGNDPKQHQPLANEQRSGSLDRAGSTSQGSGAD